MPRAPRIIISDFHYHVIVRCNNEAFHFENAEDFECYLNVLSWVQKKHCFKLYNYELMNSHVHLFLQPSVTFSLDRTMRLINWKFARLYNQRKNRKGHFWLDRYKSIPVESDRYALSLMRYINRNPLRAGIVKKLGDWQWSGYRFYALGEKNSLLSPHITYLALGDSPHTRQIIYRALVGMALPGDAVRDSKFSTVPSIGFVPLPTSPGTKRLFGTR